MPISRQASSPALRHSRSTCSPAALVHLLDPGRVDPAVGDQLLQGEPGDLAADRVEAAQQHRLGGVVDDQVDAGDLLEGADVAALAADDPALHVVAGQVHHRRPYSAVCSEASRWMAVPSTRLASASASRRASLDVAGQDRGASRASCSTVRQQLGPGLLGGEPGHLLQQRGAVGLGVGDLRRPAPRGGGAPRRRPGLALGEPLLAALDVEPLLVQVAVQLGLATRGELAARRAGRPRRPAAPRPRRRRAPRRAWTTAAAVRWRGRRGGSGRHDPPRLGACFEVEQGASHQPTGCDAAATPRSEVGVEQLLGGRDLLAHHPEATDGGSPCGPACRSAGGPRWRRRSG